MNSSIGNIRTIAKRELVGYFSSPVAFVFIVIFLVVAGFFTFKFGHWFEIGQAALGQTSYSLMFFGWHPWLYLFLVPAIGMGMWSEERRGGTIELLLTMPITAWLAIVGKFFAAWSVLALALALTFPIVVTVNYLGHPDNGVILGGYIGSLLMAGAYLSISCMTSAMTRNQVVSFIVSIVIILLLIFAGFPQVTEMFVTWAPPLIVDGVAACSIWSHFESIQKGVLDSRDVLYFLSVIVFGLFTTGVVVRAHRAG